MLHRQRNASEQVFGTGLRCSGCHVNGGLLQKELTPPHNDWFVKNRALPMGALRPDAFVKGKLANAVDAGELSKLVSAGAQRLAASPGYRKVLAARSMQERLRPLFCPMEVNIESDPEAFDDHKPTLQVPSSFFVDSRLAAGPISIKREHYDAALQRVRSRLPKNAGRTDADHAWLTPVKAQSDMVAVDSLVEQGVVDNEFVAAVLAVDFTNPVFSKRRCDLLKLVPEERGPDFVARFQSALRGASVPGAVELLDNLSDPARNVDFHKKQALAFLANCQQRSAESRYGTRLAPPSGSTASRSLYLRDIAESGRPYPGGPGSGRLPRHAAASRLRRPGVDLGMSGSIGQKHRVFTYSKWRHRKSCAEVMGSL